MNTEHLARLFAGAMQRNLETVLQFGSRVRAAMYREYERRGCPYGPGDAGFIRWVREEGAKAREQSERDVADDRRRAVEDFAATVAARKAARGEE